MLDLPAVVVRTRAFGVAFPSAWPTMAKVDAKTRCVRKFDQRLTHCSRE